MWNSSLSELQIHLAELFPLKEDIIRIAGTAGLSVATISVSDKGIIFWYNVLTEARLQGRLDEIITEARRIYPEDQKLTSFNTLMIDNDKEVNIGAIKELCSDLIRDGQFREALPLVEGIVSHSTSGSDLEENIVTAFANLHRHQNDAEESSGNKHNRSLRFMESSKTDLISLIQAL